MTQVTSGDRLVNDVSGQCRDSVRYEVCRLAHRLSNNTRERVLRVLWLQDPPYSAIEIARRARGRVQQADALVIADGFHFGVGSTRQLADIHGP